MAVLTGPVPVIGDTSVIHDSALNELGTRAFDMDGNEYIYLKGVASTAQYDWVTFDEAHLTTRAVANAKGRVGIAQAAIVANKYGWYLIYGTGLGAVLASFADNGIPYLTATAGSVDDAAVAGDLVNGAMGRSAISGSTATFELSYPFVNDASGA